MNISQEQLSAMMIANPDLALCNKGKIPLIIPKKRPDFDSVKHRNSLKLNETQFGNEIEKLFNLFAWRWSHFRAAWSSKGYRTPIKGYKGFPDYVAVRKSRLLFIEIKDDYAKTSPDQEAWLEALRECHRIITSEPLIVKGSKAELKLNQGVRLLSLPEVYLWRPKDWENICLTLR